MTDNFFRQTRSAALIALAFAIQLLLTTAAQANQPTQIVINQTGAKFETLYNPIQFSGVAADGDGIMKMRAVVRKTAGNWYLTPGGGGSSDYTTIPLRFNVGAKRTKWVSEVYQLRPGQYQLGVVVFDARGKRSKQTNMLFKVKKGSKPASANTQASNQTSQTTQASAAGAATASTPATTTRAPAIAIKSPRDGAKIKGVAQFTGVAGFAGGISDVIATLTDLNSGLLLGPDGKFHRRAQLKLDARPGKKVRWASPRMKLPPGEYEFAVRGFAANGASSPWAKTRVQVLGNARPQQSQSINATANDQGQAAVATSAGANSGNRPAAANGMPYCSNARMDADGDGYGWENQNSCIVAGSKADKHPNCASAASDPDGDGYGWENNKSCIVVLHCRSANSDPDGDGFGWENNKSCVVKPTSANSGRHPICRSAASDPDGDGYGWENNKSCIVR